MDEPYSKPIQEILECFESVQYLVVQDLNTLSSSFFLDQVVAEDNLGHWINQRYLDPNKLHEAWEISLLDVMVPEKSLQAINRLVNDRFAADKPELSLAPTKSVCEFWLPLTAFDITKNAKNGCGGLTKNMDHGRFKKEY